MEMKQYLIANGNPTLLVWNYLENKKQNIIKKYLGQVDQIGFISFVDGIPNLDMMGNELCINATLAFASTLNYQGKLMLNRKLLVSYKNYTGQTEITLELPYKINDNIVLLEGIGFIFVEKDKSNNSSLLKNLVKTYNLPAFGFISYSGNMITPYIFVKGTNSLIQETACGSGSIAYFLFKNISNVIQPSRGIITVGKQKSMFTIRSNVSQRIYRKQEGGE